jgi:hypothetical protein
MLHGRKAPGADASAEGSKNSALAHVFGVPPTPPITFHPSDYTPPLDVPFGGSVPSSVHEGGGVVKLEPFFVVKAEPLPPRHSKRETPSSLNPVTRVVGWRLCRCSGCAVRALAHEENVSGYYDTNQLIIMALVILECDVDDEAARL